MIEVLKCYRILKISGVDAANFLQKLVTNDIIKNTYSYNFLLNSQGRFIADFFVFKQMETEYLIEVHDNLLENLKKMLHLYKMRSDIKIEDVSNKHVLFYSNDEEKPFKFFTDLIYSFQDPRSNKLGYRSLINRSELSKLSDYITDTTLYLDDKYKHVVPDGFADMIPSKSLPIQYGIDKLSAVDYSKGCYVGQEVISRAKYQGNIRKKLYKAKANNIIIPPSSDATHDNVFNPVSKEKIGIVCSVYKNNAILLLSIDKIENLDSNEVVIFNEIMNIC